MICDARRRGASAALALAISFGSNAALANVTKDQCIEANGQGQELRREGKLTAARAQLQQCMNPECPTMVRDDCAKRLDDLDRAQPTIAFEVKDASGADISAVRVTVDGSPLAERLDGTALAVDIGEHAFTFEVRGQPPISRKLILTEGEKGRREVVAIGAGTPAVSSLPPPLASPAGPAAQASVLPASSQAPGTETPAKDQANRTQKILGLLTGGVGVAGIAVGSVFGLMTLSKKSQQQSDCAAPASCTSAGHAQALDDHSAGMTDSAVATVGFIAGGALLIGGAVLFVTGRRAADEQSVAGALVVPSIGPGGGGMLFRGRF